MDYSHKQTYQITAQQYFVVNYSDVRKHPRKTKSGRTEVSRHKRRNRVIKERMKKTHYDYSDSRLKRNFTNRAIRFPNRDFPTLDSISDQYFKAGYERALSNIETTKKQADIEFVRMAGSGREHHRVYEVSDGFWVESHIDSGSLKTPYKHLTQDVIRGIWDESNFNDTQWVFVDKRRN